METSSLVLQASLLLARLFTEASDNLAARVG